MEYNPYSLRGKRILVTGASSGIGRQTAIECSLMGASLVITGRNSERLEETFSKLQGTDHRMVLCDLTKQEQRESLLEGFEVLNGLVLSSGKGLTLPMQFATQDKFTDIFEVNFFQSFCASSRGI